jgi:pyruvate/2-oxoglutarate/acetoin dehydrogenase E1 component
MPITAGCKDIPDTTFQEYCSQALKHVLVSVNNTWQMSTTPWRMPLDVEGLTVGQKSDPQSV